MFVLAYGLVPILDLTSGLMKYSTYSTSTDSDQTLLLYTELVTGAISFFTWFATVGAQGGPFAPVLVHGVKFHAFAEFFMVLLVARDAKATQNQKHIGLAAHAVGCLISAASIKPIEEVFYDDYQEDYYFGEYEYGPYGPIDYVFDGYDAVDYGY